MITTLLISSKIIVDVLEKLQSVDPLTKRKYNYISKFRGNLVVSFIGFNPRNFILFKKAIKPNSKLLFFKIIYHLLFYLIMIFTKQLQILNYLNVSE